MTTIDPETAPRPNARSARAHDAVVKATRELLNEGGLQSATIDAIADRSGVSKATIYKHWPSRIAVAAEAFSVALADSIPTADTGNIVDDLTQQVRNVSGFYTSSAGRVFVELIAASVNDAAGSEYLHRYFLDGRKKRVAEIWQRAVDRGEVDAAADVEMVTDVLFGPMVLRLVTGNAKFDTEQAEKFAKLVLYGLLPTV